MRTISIGRLNKRITLMKIKEVEDEMGQTTKELSPIKTVWASLYPVRGNEFYEIQKVQSKVSHKCYIRYMDGIDSNCFIVYKNKTYSIDSVIDVDFEHKLLEIYCYEHFNKEDL